jgi:hypothetical protein
MRTNWGTKKGAAVMTQKILGDPGPERRRRVRLLPIAVLMAVGMVVLVSAAMGAVFPPNPFDPDVANYAITVDENGANDVPGQKDVSLQGVNVDNLPTSINVMWDWDETSITGANTLDACSLIDTDGDLLANFALCLTLGGQPLVQQATTLYSCGDTRVDRCASQVAVIANPTSTCSFAVTTNTDPFLGNGKAGGADKPIDTRAKCTLRLADFPAGTGNEAALINTCSYPSAQPTSAPSDCVLIPRDAFIRVIKDAGDDTTAFDFSLNGGTTFQVRDDGTGVLLGIVGGTSNSLAEGTVPTGWVFNAAGTSCTGSTVTGGNGTLSSQTISGIKAAIGTTVTCTFKNIPALRDLTRPSTPTVVPQDSVDIGNFDTSGSKDGTLTIALYSASDCSGTALYTKTFANLASGGVKATDNSGAAIGGYTISSSGTTYYWGVSYTGDSRNAAFSDCDENVTATLTGS